MARRFMRRRRFSKPVARERALWTTSLFAETAFDRTGNINEYNVIDQLAIQGGSAITGGPAKRVQTRRIIIRGNVTVSPESTTFATDQQCMLCALYVIDRDDPDGNLGTTAQSSIYEGGTRRLLWTDVYAWTIREVVSTAAESYISAVARIEIDLKVRIALAFDEVIVLGLQSSAAWDPTVANATYSGIHRCLYVDY